MKRVSVWTYALLGVTWSLPLLAGEGGQGGLLTPNPGLSLWTLITFGIVLLVLWKFAWKPLLDSLEKRTSHIENMIREADENRRKAQELMEEYTKKLEAAKQEALEIIEEGKKDAEERKKAILEEAQKEAERIKSDARREIDLATKKAKEEIWQLAVEVSTQLAERIIERSLSSEEDQKLIQKILTEYKQN